MSYHSIKLQKAFAFTGKLSIVRRDAIQAVIDAGGYCLSNCVTRNTDYLVLGTPNDTKAKRKKSNKLLKAEMMKLKGHPIQIISEDAFFEMLGVYQYKLAM